MREQLQLHYKVSIHEINSKKKKTINKSNSVLLIKGLVVFKILNLVKSKKKKRSNLKKYKLSSYDLIYDFYLYNFLIIFS